MTWKEGKVMTWMLNETKEQPSFLKYTSDFRLNRKSARTSTQPQSNHKMSFSNFILVK